MDSLIRVSAGLLGFLLWAGDGQAEHRYPGGATTVNNQTSLAFSLPAANLAEERLSDFFVGNSFFKNNWVFSPASATARDGLGPHYIARSCSSCHLLDGRGRPPAGDESPVGLLLKTRAWRDGQVTAHPELGEQLTTLAGYGQSAEARIRVSYQTLSGQFADGDGYELLRPQYHIELPAESMRLSQPVIVSPRTAPQLIGLGLLEALSVETLQSLADPDDTDHDGISGRLVYVDDRVNKKTSPGRFGWKSAAPNVQQQVAGALNNDIGITSVWFPQTDRDNQYNESDPEISAELLDKLAFYSMNLAVPAARVQDEKRFADGQQLFHQTGCAACHTATLTTGRLPGHTALSEQTIHAYTDLLLHDMGDGLADAYYPDAPAQETPQTERFRREWRTPPLWGLGLLPVVNGHSRLLHDGRARNISEAILWHGGEAQQARDGYLQMPRAQRELLLEFLDAI